MKIKGVTLIEVLMVVLIISIIGAVGIPRISVSSHQAKVAALQRNLSQIRQAVHQRALETSISSGSTITQSYNNINTIFTNLFDEGWPINPFTTQLQSGAVEVCVTNSQTNGYNRVLDITTCANTCTYTPGVSTTMSCSSGGSGVGVDWNYYPGTSSVSPQFWANSNETSQPNSGGIAVRYL